MKKYAAILFDFDGTLMDTSKIVFQSWQHVYNELTGKDGDAEVIYGTFGEPLIVSAAKLFPDNDPEDTLSLYRKKNSLMYEGSIILFPGTIEMLEAVKRAGYKTALVTSRFRKTAEIAINKFGLERFMDYTICIDECKKGKPDPEPINNALKLLEISAESALMVGDSQYDYMCARNAGVDFVQVGWARKLSPDPDYIIEHSTDLLKVLEIEKC